MPEASVEVGARSPRALVPRAQPLMLLRAPEPANGAPPPHSHRVDTRRFLPPLRLLPLVRGHTSVRTRPDDPPSEVCRPFVARCSHHREMRHPRFLHVFPAPGPSPGTPIHCPEDLRYLLPLMGTRFKPEYRDVTLPESARSDVSGAGLVASCPPLFPDHHSSAAFYSAPSCAYLA